MTTILVTGATGTVGSEVVKQLVSALSSTDSNNYDNNIIIRAAIHSENRADKFKEYSKTVKIVNIDYNKPETVADALNQVDKLFLLTLPSPDMTVYSNLVKEIRKYGEINHIVKLSSMEQLSRLNFQPQLVEYIEKKKESLRNLEYRLHSCVLLRLCKIS